MQYKYTETRLKAMRKDKLFSLCLKHYGYDTASIYRHYTKAELIDDLALLPRTKPVDTRCLIGIANHDTQTITANPCQLYAAQDESLST